MITVVILESGTNQVRNIGITYSIGTAMPTGVNKSRTKIAAAAVAAMIQPPEDGFTNSAFHRAG
ncbi:MAG: hypothetical protein A4E19_04770 [Nitrospira sp. SG-bin1]|nr:MAG: hypothetical protein A4E19_04770 [Nitrospira sp. SG-bin1]